MNCDRLTSARCVAVTLARCKSPTLRQVSQRAERTTSLSLRALGGRAMTNPNHGGKRPGSGRPPVAFPRQKVTVRLHPDTIKGMDVLRARKGLCLGRWLDETVRWLLDPLK